MPGKFSEGSKGQSLRRMGGPSKRSRMAQANPRGGGQKGRHKAATAEELPCVRWEWGELRVYRSIAEMAKAPLPPEAMASEPPPVGCAVRTEAVREELRRRKWR